MFEKLEVLSMKAHKELHFTPSNNFSFAQTVNMAPLAINEIIPASQHFPVVFSVTDPLTPYALFSLENGVNRFVSDNGQWLAGYLPFHIRRFPFILSAIEEGKSYGVCIDRAASHFSGDSGQALFDSEGKPGAIVEEARKMLSKYQADMLNTSRIMNELRSRNLLEPCKLEKVNGDDKKLLGNFYVINMDKVAKLDAGIIKHWVKNGMIGIFYAQAHSLLHLNLFKQSLRSK